MAQWSQDGHWITGRIGFESEGQRELWDDAAKDYVERAIRLAQTVPYAINTETLRIVFQLRGNVVRPGTFRGNFQALLNEASPYWFWTVALEGLRQPEGWEEWIASAERIVQLRVHLERANPRYRGKQVRDVFEESKAAAADLVVKAPEDGSLDPTAPSFVRQAIEHAQGGYGSYSAVAEVRRGKQTRKDTWRSTLEGEVEKKTVPADPAGEVPPDKLREVLEQEEEEQ